VTDATTFEVRSPLDGSRLADVPIYDAPAVAEAVARARAAQPAWAALGARARARRMEALAGVLRRRSDEIAQVVRKETGKPFGEALTEVAVSADLIRFYAQVAPDHLGPRRVGTGWMPWKKAWVEREPHGVVGAIAPWNYPFILVMDCVSPALFAGNAVVVKPSEFTPLSALLVRDLCRDAGLPAELVEVATGDGRTGEALVRAGVDRIVFTGSTSAGRKVMAAAADTLTPVTLELGGKDPAIVLEDADLERAVPGVVFGALFNAGQTCLSVERVLVARRIQDDFVRRATALVATLRIGTGPDADVGPMVTAAQAAIVERHVSAAVAGGARVVTGGHRQAPGSGVYLPTILVDVDPSMDIWSRESFGPLLPVVPFDSDDEAVRMANAGGYGLFASVWTQDRDRGLRMARRLRAGGVSINDVLSHYAVPGLPMGGVGQSGFGRRRGIEGLEEMCRTRTLLVDRLGRAREPWWYPYTAAQTRLTRAVLEWRTRRGPGGLIAFVRGLSRKRDGHGG
jgi:acyl-CoA reductase-like NAD-dependent aldehyde dehydrogenase